MKWFKSISTNPGTHKELVEGNIVQVRHHGLTELRQIDPIIGKEVAKELARRKRASAKRAKIVDKRKHNEKRL